MTPYNGNLAQSERVLIVDDNATNLQVLFQTLNGRGYKLLIAKSGTDALSIIRKIHPDLILLDIIMPEMNGYEVCRQLKADPETWGTAVIFLSALDETRDKVQGFALGAVDYITKPFQAEEVIARVDTHLTIQRLKRTLAEKNRQLEAANERMRKDLEAAARIQQALLPSLLPEVDRARFGWKYRPCDELGGDSLNIHKLDERHVSLFVLDVCGHGVPAALLSVTVTRSLSPHPDPFSLVIEPSDDPDRLNIVSPGEVARRLNTLYPMDFKARQYFTIIYGILDIQTFQFRFISAGHPDPILVRENSTGILAGEGVPIGIIPDADYREAVVDLQPGDRLYFHSDGLYEERNPYGEEFGRERLLAAMANDINSALQDSIDDLVNTVVAWRGNEHLRDDISILALEIE